MRMFSLNTPGNRCLRSASRSDVLCVTALAIVHREESSDVSFGNSRALLYFLSSTSVTALAVHEVIVKMVFFLSPFRRQISFHCKSIYIYSFTKKFYVIAFTIFLNILFIFICFFSSKAVIYMRSYTL